MGSNSTKLVNYNIFHDNSYNPYYQDGYLIKLSEGLTETGFIGQEQMQRAIDVLKLFKDVIRVESINHVLPIATSATREAANKFEFLQKIYQETGFKFRILSGTEEALYSYVGALRSLRIPTVLFFDLGGGSLELVYAENFQIKKIMSLPLGALRLTQMYSDDGNFSSQQYEKMKFRIDELIPDRNELKMDEDTILVGVGGTLRNIAKYNQKLTNYPFSKIHNYTMKSKSVFDISKGFRSLGKEKIAKIDSISTGRAETMIAGSCVIEMIMKKLAFDKIVVSAQGLREGTLSVSLEHPKLFSSGDLIERQKIENSVKFACEQDLLPLYLEDFVRSLISINVINEGDRKIFAQAIRRISKVSSFRNLGNIVYLIMDEDSSLTHREQLISALSIIYSIKKKKAERLLKKYDSILLSQDKKTIKKIATLVTFSKIFQNTKAKITLSRRNDNQIDIEVLPNGISFPENLFNTACKRFCQNFGLDIQYSINKKKTTILNSKS
jgi:exopolyphosphatase/guanosine-5'-triphosphate,3'-diphosphate pyrophosphatase